MRPLYSGIESQYDNLLSTFHSMMYRGIFLGLGAIVLLSSQSAQAKFIEDVMLKTSTGSMEESATDPATEEATPADETNDEDTLMSDQPMAATAIISRAEFTAAVVEKLYTQADLDRCFWSIAPSLPPTFTLVFTDVHTDDRFAKHICIAMRDGIIKGYTDGSFRPNKDINFVESAKILSRAFVLAPYAQADRLTPWYEAHVKALDARGAIPTSITRLDQLLTVADAAEMMLRVANNTTWLPSRTYDELKPKPPIRRQAAPVTVKPVPKPSSATSAQSSSTTSQAAASSVSSKKSFWNPF